MIRPVILFALLLATPAAAQGPCLSGDAARDGVLVSLRQQHPNGSWFRAFVLRLPKPVCVLDEDGGRHAKQREIGLFPENEAEFAHYVGRAVHRRGGPDRRRHCLARARLDDHACEGGRSEAEVRTVGGAGPASILTASRPVPSAHPLHFSSPDAT